MIPRTRIRLGRLLKLIYICLLQNVPLPVCWLPSAALAFNPMPFGEVHHGTHSRSYSTTPFRRCTTACNAFSNHGMPAGFQFRSHRLNPFDGWLVREKSAPPRRFFFPSTKHVSNSLLFSDFDDWDDYDDGDFYENDDWGEIGDISEDTFDDDGSTDYVDGHDNYVNVHKREGGITISVGAPAQVTKKSLGPTTFAVEKPLPPDAKFMKDEDFPDYISIPWTQELFEPIDGPFLKNNNYIKNYERYHAEAPVVDVSETSHEPIVHRTVPVDPNWKGPQPYRHTADDVDFEMNYAQELIETSEQRETRLQMTEEIESGKRKLPEWTNEFGETDQELEERSEMEKIEGYGDLVQGIDPLTIGKTTTEDLEGPSIYDWEPEETEDPNIIDDKSNYYQEKLDGPYWRDRQKKFTKKLREEIEQRRQQELLELNILDCGPYEYEDSESDDDMMTYYAAFDERTKVGVTESYMVDPKSRPTGKRSPLEEQFHSNDSELKEQEEFFDIRNSMRLIETYNDPFLPNVTLPAHVATWHGYPEKRSYPPKPYTNNRFTKPENLTNYDALGPFRARKTAVEMARSRNPEWLSKEDSEEWHMKRREPLQRVGSLVGTFEKGDCDPVLVEKIQPALKLFGNVVELLEIIDGRIYRFKFYGPIRNRYGMSCWMKHEMEEQCGVKVDNVIFETGSRVRDKIDGGDPYFYLDI